jgi:hypothetical protein
MGLARTGITGQSKKKLEVPLNSPNVGDFEGNKTLGYSQRLSLSTPGATFGRGDSLF